MENENEVMVDKNEEKLIKKQSNSNLSILILTCSLAILTLVAFLYLSYYGNKRHLVLVDDKDFIKPYSDYRQYRVVRLDNKLDVILISDPKASKSSASMSVGVGSFMDNEEVQGLAHFCEHMLFLGSKSFPKVGEFDDWLVSNSGSSNAFTESERTTFYFEVDNIGFNKTLFMFSRMFAEPLFDINFMNKEIDAVNSEHEKNLNSDSWRKLQLIRSLSNPKHPHHKFSTGNNSTLRSIPAEKLNVILKEFYLKYYISSNMKLAILSNYTLDAMQVATEKYFSDIPHNSQSMSLYGNLGTNETVFTDLGKIVWFKKISAGATLDFYFSIDSVSKYYKIKPLDYIDYLIRFAGEKSLLSLLRKRKLANKIDTSFQASHLSFAIFKISLELTNDGLKEVELVMRMFYNYLNLIKHSNISKNIFDEINKIYDVNFKFLDKNDDYSSFLASLSTSMFNYQYSDLLYGEYTHSVYDESVIKYYTDSLTPDKSIVVIGSDIDMTNLSFFKDSKLKFEKYYKVEYIEAKLDESYLRSLNSYPVAFEKKENVDPKKSFRLRTKNNYITNLNELVKDCIEMNEECDSDEFEIKNEDFTPINLFDDNNLKIFYKIDKTFKVPRVIVYLKILTKEFKTNAEDFLYLNFLVNYLEYNLSTLLSEPLDTGNSFQIEMSENGIILKINCFTDLLEKIFKLTISEIFKFTPDPHTFDEIIEITSKKFNENKNSKPIQKNKMYFDKIVKYNITLYSEMLNLILNNENMHKESEANIKKNANNEIYFQNFLNAYENFKNDIIITLLAWGNIEKSDVDKLKDVIKPFTNKPRDQLKQTHNIYYITNSIHLHRRIDEPITFQIKNEVLNEVNHAVTHYYQIGPKDLKKALYLAALDKCIGQVFYYNLRTVQQLGYIVHAGSYFSDSIMYYRILVQGSKKLPREIDQSIDDVINLALEKVKSCDGEHFEKVKQGIRAKLSRKDDNISERTQRVWREISENTYEFDRNIRLIEGLDKLKPEVLLSFFENLFLQNPSKLSIHNYSNKFSVPATNTLLSSHLNKKIKDSYTENFKALENKDFIYANKIFSNPIKRIKNNIKKNKKSLRYGKLKNLEKNSYNLYNPFKSPK